MMQIRTMPIALSRNVTQRATSSPPMLEIFIILNEKDAEKGEGKGAEGKRGE